MNDDHDGGATGAEAFMNAFRRQEQSIPRFPHDRNARQVMPPSDMQGQVMAMGQVFEPFDPSAESDPFGFTASMQFPTQFSFEESSLRK